MASRAHKGCRVMSVRLDLKVHRDRLARTARRVRKAFKVTLAR